MADYLRKRGMATIMAWLWAACLLWPTDSIQADHGFLQLTNGYFWDGSQGKYFLARGVAYQVWNPPVLALQSLDQLDYDLTEFKKLHANSVRCELTWGEVQKGPTQFDWSKADHLVAKAEELGLKLFILIGYQYPPAWFPNAYHGVNNQYTTSNVPTEVPPEALSNVINYELPEARNIYSDYLAAVAGRYKDSRAIGAWIVGNEYAYFDLWENPDLYPARRFIGYDPVSQASFRRYLQNLYQTNLALLNANWQTNFASFEAVVMPRDYPPSRRLPGYQDLIQWRKHSIGGFVAAGARAVKQADPNHLITYSMVGGIFSGQDANYTCEDAAAIVADCKAAGAPLDFWSINNYAVAAVGSEMRSADYGIAKYRLLSGLPVMISETGHSSTEKEEWAPGAGGRQAKALPSTLWESLASGAIGVHFFHWNDRNLFPTNVIFYRENGFGIVQENRLPKMPVYTNIMTMFRQMENIRLGALLGGSLPAPPDIQFFWSTNADMVWPRANQENAMLWGALKRIGYQLGILDDAAFERGDFRRAPALLLSRSLQMSPSHLQQVADAVLPAGIHVCADADLPGQFDAYDVSPASWPRLMNATFGINVASAWPAWNTGATNDSPAPLNLQGLGTLGAITPATRINFTTWKIWQGVAAASARVIMTHSGYQNSAPGTPALFIKTNAPGTGRTAITTFAVGDTHPLTGDPAAQWGVRFDLLRAIFHDHFGLQPAINLSGVGARYLIPNYRFCANGSVLISLLNEHTNAASVTVSAPSLLQGRRVERLITGGILSTNSDGAQSLTIDGDELVLLYAYGPPGRPDASLVNPNPNKLWFESAPLALWPRGTPYPVALGYDTEDSPLKLVVALEQIQPAQRTLSRAELAGLQGKGLASLMVDLPDADPNDPNSLSSRTGGQYVFHAWIEKVGLKLSDSIQPVRLLWGVHPTQPTPYPTLPGQTYLVTLEWEELPSYLPGDPTPLDRAALFDSLLATAQHYNVVLELRAGDQVVAADSFLTRRGTASHQFRITAPPTASGPFTWKARLETAPNVLSHDVQDGFEGRQRGATVEDKLTLIDPWTSYIYPANSGVLWQNQGIHPIGSEGSQSAFLVVTNPPDQTASGFGLARDFPAAWALPADHQQWTNFVFSYDFAEANLLPCLVEMQVKSANSNWIQFGQSYAPGTNGWYHIQATLDQFVPSGLPGDFDPTQVKTLVLNVRMLQPSVQYVGSFDNVRFSGPEVNLGGGAVAAIYTSANDSAGQLRIGGNGAQRVISWTGNGVLESADRVTGPWTVATNASNPWPVAPLIGQQFYRLRR